MQKKDFSRPGQEANFKIPDLFVKMDEELRKENAKSVQTAAGGTIVAGGRVPKDGPPVIRDGSTIKDGRTVKDGKIKGDTATIRDGRTIKDGHVRTDAAAKKVTAAPVYQEAGRPQQFLITPEAEMPRQHVSSSDQNISQQPVFLGSREELVRAFVLAEILGKPRALKDWEEERF